MRRLIWTAWLALGSVASPMMAQSLHPPVATFPINNGAPSASPAAVATPARPIVAAVPAPAPMVAAPSSASVASPAPVSRPAVSERVGDVTQQLLAAQAQGIRAGTQQPMLGATATAGWTRYIDSFNHPIPEWFDQAVETK